VDQVELDVSCSHPYAAFTPDRCSSDTSCSSGIHYLYPAIHVSGVKVNAALDETKLRYLACLFIVLRALATPNTRTLLGPPPAAAQLLRSTNPPSLSRVLRVALCASCSTLNI